MIRIPKKIFVTGATGFLGRHFLADAPWSDFEFYVLTRNKAKFSSMYSDLRLTVLEGSLSDITKFSKELSSCDYFVHMAGEKRNESEMVEQNVQSFKGVLSEITRHPGIKFMLISSAGVYGIRQQNELQLSEEKPCLPASTYEQTKLSGETELIKWASEHQRKYVILRPTNIIGEHDRYFKLLNLMRALKKGMFFLIDSQAWVNYVYVKYVTLVMWEMIQTDHFDNDIYNVNSPMKLSSFIDMLKAELDVERKTYLLPAWLVYPVALLSDKLLPSRFQAINIEKYEELVNKKIYPVDKLKTNIHIDEQLMLSRGMRNLVGYYQQKNLL